MTSAREVDSATVRGAQIRASPVLCHSAIPLFLKGAQIENVQFITTSRITINHNTRSSSLVTLARPSTSSSLRITDRSFRCASRCLWNQLPSFLRQPHSGPSVSDLPVPAPTTSSHSVNSPRSPSVTPSLFHSRLKTDLFSRIFSTGLGTDSAEFVAAPFILSVSVFLWPPYGGAVV